MGCMDIELGLEGEKRVVFADLDWGEACLMRGERSALFVKVGDNTAMLLDEKYFGGMEVRVVNPEDETVKPMHLERVQARPKQGGM